MTGLYLFRARYRWPWRHWLTICAEALALIAIFAMAFVVAAFIGSFHS